MKYIILLMLSFNCLAGPTYFADPDKKQLINLDKVQYINLYNYSNGQKYTIRFTMDKNYWIEYDDSSAERRNEIAVRLLVAAGLIELEQSIEATVKRLTVEVNDNPT